MLSKAESACFAIADISGYTHFMSGVELDHAQGIIADIMDTLVRALRPPFRLAKFEGDAAFVYVVADKVDGSLLQAQLSRPILRSASGCATSSRPTAASAKPVAGWRASTSSSSFIKASSSGKRCRAARNSPAGT
jgi:hypothetical protein